MIVSLRLLLSAPAAVAGYCGRVVGTPGVTAQCGWKPVDSWPVRGKLSGRLVVDGLLVALHALEHLAQACDFDFELGDALDHRGRVPLGLGGSVGGGKAKPDLVAAAPGH